jgi:hypothetical protein
MTLEYRSMAYPRGSMRNASVGFGLGVLGRSTGGQSRCLRRSRGGGTIDVEGVEAEKMEGGSRNVGKR